MKEVAAYLLCVLGGNESPSADDVTKVISAGGAEPAEESIAALVGDLEGKSVNDLLAEGMEKLKDVPMGGSGGGGGGGGAAGGDAAAEEVKEEEEEEEEAPPMASDMFGGGDADGGDY